MDEDRDVVVEYVGRLEQSIEELPRMLNPFGLWTKGEKRAMNFMAASEFAQLYNEGRKDAMLVLHEIGNVTITAGTPQTTEPVIPAEETN